MLTGIFGLLTVDKMLLEKILRISESKKKLRSRARKEPPGTKADRDK